MENPVILFDSDCGFCRWSLSKMLAWDRAGRLRPVALQSSEADDLLTEIDPEQKAASWHLIVGGRVHSGGEAVSHLARLLPGGTPIALLASTFPRTTDRAYRWVARHRDRLGRVLGEQACAVDPTRAFFLGPGFSPPHEGPMSGAWRAGTSGRRRSSNASPN